MRALAAILVAMQLACSVDLEGAPCDNNSNCPSDQRCGPDKRCASNIKPTISNVALSCSGNPCLRDSMVTVSATVDSLRSTVVSATVLSQSVPMDAGAGQGGNYNYSATFALNGFPFYSSSVTAQVTASDSGGSSNAASSSVMIYRLKWARPVESVAPLPKLTAAAIDAAGNIYVGGDNSKLYVLQRSGNVANSWTVGSGGITAPPSIGPNGVWVASGGRVYGVKVSDGSILNGSGCLTGSVTAAPALSGGNPETAWVGSQSQRVFEISALACSSNQYPSENFSAAAAIDSSGFVYVASSAGKLRSLKDAGGFPVDNWTSPALLGGPVTLPLAWDGARVLSVGSGGLYATTVTPTAGSASLLKPVTNPTDPIVDGSGYIVLGDGNALLRIDPTTGAAKWQSPDLGAHPVSAMALKGGDADYVVSTTAGTIHALKADGTVLWSGPLTSGPELREGNIFKGSGDGFSTAVFGAADGTVYAVVVDGALDSTAPWPKAHHDTRNTGNAASQLP
jgi:outer membrane protein assembly factor BamB